MKNRLQRVLNGSIIGRNYRDYYSKTFYIAKLSMSKQLKPQNGHSKPGEGKDPATSAGVKSYKKIAIPELPVIGLNDGPNILHIRDALIQYCERELGTISGIFSEV